jgi:predicted transcriptional regulator
VSIVQVRVPDDIHAIIDREVSNGSVASADAWLIEAARRFAADLELEHDLVSEAAAGIADAEAGRYVTVATPAAAETWHDRLMARVADPPAAAGT